MAIHDLIIHRGNAPVNTVNPVDQVGYYVSQGFTKIEIDIYALTQSTFKFCHPLDKHKVPDQHDLNDGFLSGFVEAFPGIEWYVDLKCLDVSETPFAMIDCLVAAFRISGIFVSAQKDVLEYVHGLGMRTGQYFRIGQQVELDYQPEFYLQDTADTLRYPKDRTIVCGADVAGATGYLDDGFIGAMVDGDHFVV